MFVNICLQITVKLFADIYQKYFYADFKSLVLHNLAFNNFEGCNFFAIKGLPKK